VRADLEYAYWGGPQHWLNRPEVFFAGFLCGPDGLRRIAAGAPRYHDDRPRLEYSTAAHQEAVQASEVLALLRANLEPLETLFGAPPDPALAEASARLREQNLDDIPVSAALLDAEKMLRAQGEPRRVLELLAQCRKRNPDNVALAYLIGEACRALGNLSEAIWAYEDALRIDPAYVVAHNRLGALLLQRQDLDGAQRHAAEAVRLRPTFAEAHNNLGAALAHRGQLDQAEHHFAEAVRLDPDYAVAHCNLGILLARRGQTEEAAAQFRAALRIKPDYQTAARALETLATSQRGSGR
jgi:tetratricopeptide (TPR) repeat protein